MIAAPVQCDVDGIPKGSHYVKYPPNDQSGRFSDDHTWPVGCRASARRRSHAASAKLHSSRDLRPASRHGPRFLTDLLTWRRGRRRAGAGVGGGDTERWLGPPEFCRPAAARLMLFPARKKYSNKVATLLLDGQVEVDGVGYANPSDAATALVAKQTAGRLVVLPDRSGQSLLAAEDPA
jgi:hypothetical protein